MPRGNRSSAKVSEFLFDKRIQRMLGVAFLLVFTLTGWSTLKTYADDMAMFLKISMKTTESGTGVLYYDAGKGFNEESKNSLLISGDGRFYELSFRIPFLATIFGLRFDPPSMKMGEGIITRVELVDHRDWVLHRFSLDRLNPIHQIKGFLHENGEIRFSIENGADDPQIYIQIDKPLKLPRGRIVWNILSRILLEGMVIFLFCGVLIFIWFRWRDKTIATLIVLALLAAGWVLYKEMAIFVDEMANDTQIEIQTAMDRSSVPQRTFQWWAFVKTVLTWWIGICLLLAVAINMSRAKASKTVEKNYFLGFEYLRVFFAIAIVAWHTRALGITSLFNPALFQNFKAGLVDLIYGNVFLVGVPIFLQLSLFLYIYNRDNKPNYFWKRLKYLIILYVFWVTASMVFIGPGIAVSHWKSVQFVISGGSSHIYFLFSLVFCTAITELFFQMQKALKDKQHLFLHFFLFAIVFLFLSFRVYLPAYFPQGKYLYVVMAYYSPINFLPYVFSSFMFYYYFKKGKLNVVNIKKVLAAVVVTAVLLLLEWRIAAQPFNFTYDGMPISAYARPSIIVSTLVLFYIFAAIKLDPPKIIRSLSELTLGVYLIHFYLMFKLGTIWPEMWTFAAKSNLRFFIVILFISFTLAYIVKKQKIM